MQLPTKEDVARNLRKYRLLAGYESQYGLVRAVNEAFPQDAIDLSTLSRYETADQWPHSLILWKIAFVLKCPMEAIVNPLNTGGP